MNLDLREPWSDLLRRRPALREALAIYGEVLTSWAGASTSSPPLELHHDLCRDRWQRGVPLLAESRAPLSADAVEELLAPLLELTAGVRPELVPVLEAFATAWDRGDIGPDTLLPSRGRIGSPDHDLGLEADVVAFLAVGSLRPLLEATLMASRQHLGDGDWSLGICPFCGAPPGWGDITEDGRLRLACHLCGGTWAFPRAQCPFCGTTDTKELRRLSAETGEGGYGITACTKCRGYLKEMDRRERWNGGPPLLEDWGSPHLDLAVMREGYRRPLAPLIATIPRVSG